MPRRPNKGERPKTRALPPESALRQDRPRCRCGKVRSATKQEAVATQLKIAQEKGRQNPIRFYECEFGSWHWTRALVPKRQCGNCAGWFRPGSAESDATICDTCTELLTRYAPPPPHMNITLGKEPQ